MRANPRVRLLVIGVLALTGAGAASVAVAHYLRSEAYVWEDGNGHCLKARVEISDGRDQDGYTKVNAFPREDQKMPPPFDDVACAREWHRELKVRTKLLKKGASGWHVCRKTRWKRANARQLEQEVYWEKPCGNGLYRARGIVYLKRNGKWKGGGYTHRESHYLE